ncbi:hypothetical protein KZ813_06075 [Sphingomonas sp. RHCKR7]|uniref:hypothetical protein n=1 Tax=Sphingomonas folli TaxID=2862497 RepID=UPI001CA4B357|nr:hypothetical protein [Sphingomonas folli]MBW6526402.1 hypothetical protein [Sphingomonas folli]
MDINYILGREQTSLHNAAMASSSCARASHLGLAAAYGRLLADSTFPHRPPLQPRSVVVGEGGVGRQGRDGAPSLIIETAAAESICYGRRPRRRAMSLR